MAPALLSPLASVIGAWALVRAAVLGKRRDGIIWRGTRYSTETLRRGMRLNLGLTARVKEEEMQLEGDRRLGGDGRE